MGSSNGVTRGQLRPYFSGRTPPFIIVGTLIVLIIFGFSYWTLNAQYGDLQIEVHEFQEQLRVAAQKRIDLAKQSQSLQEQLLTAQETSSKCQDSLQKKDDELTDLSEQLRYASKMQRQLDSTNHDLEKCQEEKRRNDIECNSQKDISRQLVAEIESLKKVKDELQQNIQQLENEIAEMKEKTNEKNGLQISNQGHDVTKKPMSVPEEQPKETSNVVQHQEEVKPNNLTSRDSTEVQVTLGNPDVGQPPSNDGLPEVNNVVSQNVLAPLSNNIDPNPPRNGDTENGVANEVAKLSNEASEKQDAENQSYINEEKDANLKKTMR